MSATRPRNGSLIVRAQAVVFAKDAWVVVLDEAEGVCVLPEDVRLGVSDAVEQDAKKSPKTSAGASRYAFLIPEIVLGIARPARGGPRTERAVEILPVDAASS